MKKTIISMVLVLLLMPLLAVGADKIPPKQKLPEKNVAEKEHSESPAEQLKAKEEDDEQSRIKESVVKRLNQIAEKIEIYSKKPKESMAKITDAWIEKRRSEIWNPLLDKLAEKIEKNPDNEIQKEIDKYFDELTEKLNKEENIKAKLDKVTDEIFFNFLLMVSW